MRMSGLDGGWGRFTSAGSRVRHGCGLGADGGGRDGLDERDGLADCRVSGCLAGQDGGRSVDGGRGLGAGDCKMC